VRRHRIRPTALIRRGDQILLIEYTEEGQLHYNLPGGGLKKGEQLVEGLIREVREEANAAIGVGPIAYVYEFHPLKQSGDYAEDERPSLSIIFDCKLKDGEEPMMPEQPDPLQTGVTWLPIHQLKSVVLYPNIADFIIRYCEQGHAVELIEDYQLPSYKQG